MKTSALIVAAAALGAVLIAGCGSANHTATTKLTAAHSTSSGTTSAAQVPNPFRIVARYSASSLGLKNPRDLAMGPDGNLYVTDATDRVTVVSPEGKVLRRWGGHGKGPGEFMFLTSDSRDPTYLAASIAVAPNAEVYVSDSGNARVEVFSPTGRFIRQFGSSIQHVNGHLLMPDDLVVDSNGDVYVSDIGQNVVEKYSPTGAFLWQAGSNEPDLNGYLGLASIDRHGLIVVSSDVGAISYLDPRGHEVDVFHTIAALPNGVGPCDVSLDSLGDAFVQSCPGLASVGEPSSPPVQYALVFNRTHNLIAAWRHAPFARSPRFGPNDEVFALGFKRGGYCFRCPPNTILKLKVALH